MTAEKPKTTRYYVKFEGRNYIAVDSQTKTSLFVSGNVPDGATLEQKEEFGKQAENYLDTLYPKWREAGAY